MNRIIRTILFSLALGAAWIGAAAPVQIVLLGGQSNMAGAGNFDALSAADRARVQAIADRVQISRDGKPPCALSSFPSKHALKNRGFTETFGPEIFIGTLLAENDPDGQFLLIKVSQGGTALYGAWNPEWTAEKANAVETKEFKKTLKLYSKHMQAIDRQVARLDAAGIEYEFFGMAWMQGENDAATELASTAYETNLRKLIAGYRAKTKTPALPFVCGQINSRYGDYDLGPATVRKAFVDVTQSDAHASVILTTPEPPWTDYPKHDDQVHYNHIGQKRLGTAMGQALLKLHSPRN